MTLNLPTQFCAYGVAACCIYLGFVSSAFFAAKSPVLLLNKVRAARFCKVKEVIRKEVSLCHSLDPCNNCTQDVIAWKL